MNILCFNSIRFRFGFGFDIAGVYFSLFLLFQSGPLKDFSTGSITTDTPGIQSRRSIHPQQQQQPRQQHQQQLEERQPSVIGHWQKSALKKFVCLILYIFLSLFSFLLTNKIHFYIFRYIKKQKKNRLRMKRIKLIIYINENKKKRRHRRGEKIKMMMQKKKKKKMMQK